MMIEGRTNILENFPYPSAQTQTPLISASLPLKNPEEASPS
jgi:hypothetical protein